MTFFRSSSFALLTVGLCLVAFAPAADDKENEAIKEALQEAGNQMIGQWKGNGEASIDGKNILWKEEFGWGWKFDKEGGSWLALEVEGGKFINAGTLKYEPGKRVYVLTTETPDGDKLDYTGKLSRRGLSLERKEKNGDVRRINLVTLAGGARMVLKEEVQEGGKGLFFDRFQIAANKEGESFAGGASGKKNECIVTGGLGTIQVSFGGKTYYVCCSGCRDEFNENPKKYIEEFEKKK